MGALNFALILIESRVKKQENNKKYNLKGFTGMNPAQATIVVFPNSMIYLDSLTKKYKAIYIDSQN